MTSAFSNLATSTRTVFFGKPRSKWPEAYDPVSNVLIKVDGDSPFVRFHGGQRIFFDTHESQQKFLKNPTAMLMTVIDPSLPRRPDMYNLEVNCVVQGDDHPYLLVNDTTPRLQVSNGQELYFASYDHIAQFLAQPSKFIDGTTGVGFDPRCVAAHCPLSGKQISITDPITIKVEVSHGQVVWFCTQQCADKFIEHPELYYSTAADIESGSGGTMPTSSTKTTTGAKTPSGGGSPYLVGLHVHDPITNHSFTVTPDTPRVLLKHGQAIYFTDFTNMADFLKKPHKLLSILTPNGEKKKKSKKSTA